MRHMFRILAAMFVLVIAVLVFALGTWKGGLLAIVVGAVAAAVADWILARIVGPEG